MQPAQNQNLFEQKKNILSSAAISFKKLNFKYTYDCQYQGIPLQFHFNSPQFQKALENSIPDSWKIKTKDTFHIYITTPQQHQLTVEEWEDEESQDCFLFERSAIQRDFAATYLNDRQIFLTMNETLGDGLYNFLRWLLPRELLKIDQYVLHSSCIIGKDNKAYFFLGPSGAGKSTICTLNEGRHVLGDDMNILLLREGKFFAKAGAIGGLFFKDVDYEDEFPVGGFFWIKKSYETSTRELVQSKAASKFLASMANVFWETLSEEEVQKLFDFAALAADKFKVKELQFQKNTGFWNYVES